MCDEQPHFQLYVKCNHPPFFFFFFAVDKSCLMDVLCKCGYLKIFILMRQNLTGRKENKGEEDI